MSNYKVKTSRATVRQGTRVIFHEWQQATTDPRRTRKMRSPIGIVQGAPHMVQASVGEPDGVHGTLYAHEGYEGKLHRPARPQVAVMLVGKGQDEGSLFTSPGRAAHAQAWLATEGVPVLVLQPSDPKLGWSPDEVGDVGPAILDAARMLWPIDEVDVHLQGFSMGAGVAARAALRLPPGLRLRSLVLCSLGGAWASDTPPQWLYRVPVVQVITMRDKTIPTIDQTSALLNMRRAGNGVRVVRVMGGQHAMYASAVVPTFGHLSKARVGPVASLVEAQLWPWWQRTWSQRNANEIAGTDTEIVVGTEPEQRA